MMNCLHWFKSLIADRHFDDLQKDFKLYAKKRGGYFMPKHPNYDLNDESIFYVDIEQNGNMTSTVRAFDFSNFVEEKIKEENNNTLLCINEECQVLNDGEKTNYFTSILKQISILNYINENDDILGKREHLKSALTNIVEYINIEGKTTINTPSDQYLLGETIFGFLGKVPEVKSLYKILEEVDFFNPDNNQYDTFYNILISPISSSTMVVNLQPVKVSCDNYKAAYILSHIEPLFSRLTFRNISKSRLFINRLGKPFTESSLSKAKTIFNQRAEIDDAMKDEIDNSLNTLIYKR